MTEPSSSAGHPGGAALPADHPLGPAVPVPPRERDAAATPPSDTDAARDHGGPGTEGDDGGAAPAGDDGGARPAAPANGVADAAGHDDGRPDADRREAVLDPSTGASTHQAASIRDEQGTHSAGTVPAAFNGDGTPEDPAEDGRPEDAAAEPERWDSGGAPG